MPTSARQSSRPGLARWPPRRLASAASSRQAVKRRHPLATHAASTRAQMELAELLDLSRATVYHELQRVQPPEAAIQRRAKPAICRCASQSVGPRRVSRRRSSTTHSGGLDRPSMGWCRTARVRDLRDVRHADRSRPYQCGSLQDQPRLAGHLFSRRRASGAGQDPASRLPGW